MTDWDMEIIHETGCRKWIARDAKGDVDHQAWQKEPSMRLVFMTVFRARLPRLWEVAKFYQSYGVLTIAGGLHTHYEPLESLQNGIDVTVHGPGKTTVRNI